MKKMINGGGDEKIEITFKGRSPNNEGKTLQIISRKGERNYAHYIEARDRKFYIKLSSGGKSVLWLYCHEELLEEIKYILENDVNPYILKENANKYYNLLDLITGKKSEFKPEDWEKCISKEVGEKFVCETCGMELKSHKIGQQIYCTNCYKFVWRKKIPKSSFVN